MLQYASISDIDECTTMTHSCSASSLCENGVGNYSCVCYEGYTGLFCDIGKFNLFSFKSWTHSFRTNDDEKLLFDVVDGNDVLLI